MRTPTLFSKSTALSVTRSHSLIKKSGAKMAPPVLATLFFSVLGGLDEINVHFFGEGTHFFDPTLDLSLEYP